MGKPTAMLELPYEDDEIMGYCNYCIFEGNTTRKSVTPWILLDLEIIELIGYTALCVCAEHRATITEGGVRLDV